MTDADLSLQHRAQSARMVLDAADPFLDQQSTTLIRTATNAFRDGSLTPERALAMWGQMSALLDFRTTLANAIRRAPTETTG